MNERQTETVRLLVCCFGQKLISGVHKPRPKGRPRGVIAAESNARWNRIFEEKFADPGYYTTRPHRRLLQSSLANF